MGIDLGIIAALLGLLVGMVALLELGFRVGRRRVALGMQGTAGLNVVEGAVFALFGLLLAFTFSAGASRFETRRKLAVEEANAVGTAWLRLDLLPASARPALRELFQRYVDHRIDYYRRFLDQEVAVALRERAMKLQQEVWDQAIAACDAEPRDGPRTVLVVGALNQMIDITTTRLFAGRTYTPVIVFVVLFALGLGCSLLAGYSMAAAGARSSLHFVAFAVITVLTVYVIFDLEYPRAGFIRLDIYDQALVELRATMK
jgi:hypothetical protein